MSAEDIDRILAEAEQLPDPQARALVQQLASAMIELVGRGLARVTELGGTEVARRLADDPLVGSLMVLCDLHPDPPAIRVARALANRLEVVGATLDGVDDMDRGVRVRARGGVPDRVREHVLAIATSAAPDADVIVVEVDGRPVVPVTRLTVLP